MIKGNRLNLRPIEQKDMEKRVEKLKKGKYYEK